MAKIHVDPKYPVLPAAQALAIIYADVSALFAQAGVVVAQLHSNDTQGCSDSESVHTEPEGQYQS